jgi:misacylated tRNA(Ala) deacylase
MADKLYHPSNEYQKEFESIVSEVDREKGYLILEKTLFYDQGGGQPADRGILTWSGKETQVVDVQKEYGEIRHYVDGPLPRTDTRVSGKIDWDRRYKLMRMHTAQHIISKVVLNEYDASTAGNQIKPEQSRIDFEPATFSPRDLASIEQTSNRVIESDIPIRKFEMDRDELEAKTAEGRTQLELIPPDIDPLRAVQIGEFDICPCGGTHVDSTNEVGEIQIVNRESKGAGVERIEFVLNDL